MSLFPFHDPPPRASSFKQLVAKLLLLSGCLILYTAPLFGQSDKDELVHFSNLPKTYSFQDSVLFVTLYQKANTVSKFDVDSALLLMRSALQHCNRVGYSYGSANCIMGISYLYFEKGETKKALQLLTKEEQAIRSFKAPKLDMELDTKYGKYYKQLGYQDTAIRYYFKALDLLQRHPSIDTTGFYYHTIFTDLGSIFMVDKADIPVAIRYFEKGLAVARQYKNDSWLCSILIGMGGAYANQQLVDTNNHSGFRKGLKYMADALHIALKNDYHFAAKNAYNNMAAIYVNMNEPDSAELCVKKARQLPAGPNDQANEVRSLLALGASFIKKKDYTKAVTYLDQARKYSIDQQARNDLADIDKTLYALYVETGEYDKALAHLQAYTFLRDSLIDEDKIRAITELEVKYQMAEKDKSIVEQSLTLIRQQNRLKEKNIWIGIGIGSTLLLAVLLFIIRRNYQHRRRREEEKQQLWKQDEEIRHLKAVISGEEKERARIGRELHDGVVGQLSAAKMNFTMIQSKYPYPELHADFKEALSYLDDTAQELRKAAHNLMPGILIEQGLVTAVDAFCEKTATFTGIQIDVHQDGLLPRLDIDFELSVYRMVQELVQNIIKHANATRVLVQLDYHEPMLILTVEDNGVGITKKQAASGVGLNNLKTRVNALQGNVALSGNEGEGTSVYIEFDISLINSAHEI